MRYRRVLLLVGVFVPVIMGIAIYALWRPVLPIAFNKTAAQVEFLRQYFGQTYLPIWVVYSLPNGLWAFSYALAITYIWLPAERTFYRTLWLISPFLLGLGYETLQLKNIIQGTFCWIDISFALSGACVGYILIYLTLWKEDNYVKK